jgi:O-antigen/teichoic acid export membrane protein
MVTAIGRPGVIFKSNAIVACFQLCCLYPALRYWGLEGVATVVTVSFALQMLTYFPVLRLELGLSYSAVFRSVRSALLAGCALAAFGAVLERFMSVSWLSLAVKFVLGTGLYFVGFGCVTRWKIFKDARDIRDAVLLKPERPGA